MPALRTTMMVRRGSRARPAQNTLLIPAPNTLRIPARNTPGISAHHPPGHRDHVPPIRPPRTVPRLARPEADQRVQTCRPSPRSTRARRSNRGDQAPRLRPSRRPRGLAVASSAWRRSRCRERAPVPRADEAASAPRSEAPASPGRAGKKPVSPSQADSREDEGA